ncbi:hypothetical protein LX16_2138 [Stackebrandtia albiflava]|uniref:Uncharacterized protein n=1 Tax=Stackebrandtia albiflava TaxID=406432 RepID=A0A562VF44_9ACTN|nr:hypothetical protein [Stackebrandtia albiflava]TWJ16407.1 hypothetical protein LX16_2138 [Stackebrandtia albiflava]
MGFSPADLARRSEVPDPADIGDVLAEAEAALAGLDALDRLATPEHVAVFETVQQVLADTLTAVDEA